MNRFQHRFKNINSSSKTICGYLLFSLLLMCFFILNNTLFAWSIVNGVAISTAAYNQTNPNIVSDGTGGAIITWYDSRSGTDFDIYAQRVNSSGSTLWTLDGVVICTAANDQNSPTIVSDGSGGAIITWYDLRRGTNYDIYAQRVNSSGSTLWTLNGVSIFTAANDQNSPTIASDGFGGAIITWRTGNYGTFDIYAQRVNSNGSTLWTLNDVAICTASNNQWTPTIVRDGTGGAIITWYDRRSGTNYDIYAQRVNSSGSALWTPNGVAISTAANDQYTPTIVSDGSGGAIITWYDGRSGTNYDIYTQGVNSNGSTLWTLNGVAISTAANDQYTPTIVSDGFAGAIITWYDYRFSLLTTDVFAQRVNSVGSTLWTLDGVSICTAVNDQSSPTMVSDGFGGAIITWYDYRSTTANPSQGCDIYAQHVNPSGSTLWTLNGVAICTAANDQQLPTIVSDGSGGAIITWYDARSGNNDIFAQSINSGGVVPVELSRFESMEGIKE